MTEYSNYNNIFLAKNTTELLEYIKINNYAIKLKEDKQPLFRPIYNIKLVELKTLKTYIKTNLANDFIKLFKSFFKIFILFDQNLNESFYLYVNYWNLDNSTIKNQYFFFLIGKFLD